MVNLEEGERRRRSALSAMRKGTENSLFRLYLIGRDVNFSASCQLFQSPCAEPHIKINLRLAVLLLSLLLASSFSAFPAISLGYAILGEILRM